MSNTSEREGGSGEGSTAGSLRAPAVPGRAAESDTGVRRRATPPASRMRALPNHDCAAASECGASALNARVAMAYRERVGEFVRQRSVFFASYFRLSLIREMSRGSQFRESASRMYGEYGRRAARGSQRAEANLASEDACLLRAN